MKRVNFVLVFVLTTLFCFGQFPSRHPELLLEKEVTIKPLAPTLQEYGYRNLHKTTEFKSSDKPIRHSSVVGKKYFVKEVIPYQKYDNTYFRIKIESSENGTLYYDYNPRFEHEYILEVDGGLELPKDVYCSDIVTEQDKFTNVLKSSSPYSEGISFIKTVKNGNTTIFLSINEIGATATFNKTGLILLLENNKRIEKPNAPIDVKVNSGYTGATGYVYSAFVQLTSEDIKLLSENAITDNRLYVFDGTIKDGNKLKDYINCLIK